MSSEFYRPAYETDAGFYDDVYARAARDVRGALAGALSDAVGGCVDDLPGMWEGSDLMGGETDRD